VIDRRNAPAVAEARAGTVATLTVTVEEHIVPPQPSPPYSCGAATTPAGSASTYFNGREDYLRKLLPPGERRVVSGRIELYRARCR
jgi:ATP-dependent DNA helicase RecG